jgi:hypothetical protein
MYTIQTRPQTYFTGQAREGKQVLLGWLADVIVVIIFDNDGTLLEVKQHDLGIELSKGFGPEVETIVEKRIKTIQSQLEFRDNPIRVKPFFVDELHMGIKLFPEDLYDYLAHPHRYPTADAELFQADIEKWKAAGNCVLRWDDDYHLDNEGYTL